MAAGQLFRAVIMGLVTITLWEAYPRNYFYSFYLQQEEVAFATTNRATIQSNNADSSLSSHHHHHHHHHHLPGWIARYVEFHRHQMATTTAATTTSASESPNRRILRYRCSAEHICGGIGDRIRGMMASLFLSICTNATLQIDSRYPDPLELYLQPNLIQWNANTTSSTGIEPDQRPRSSYTFDGIDYSGHVFYKDPDQIPFDKYEEIVILSNGPFVPSILKNTTCMKRIMKTTTNTNTNTNYDDISNLKYDFFWTLFKWSDPVIQRATELRRNAGMSMAAVAKTTPYVAVHVRTGDSLFGYKDVRHNGDDTFQQFYQCSRKLQTALQQCFQHQHQHQQQQEVEIYVASDNPDIKARFLREAKNDDVDPSIIKASTEIEIYHPDRSKTGSVQHRDMAHLDVWAELKILVDATCLVYSKSGFSDIAATIRQGRGDNTKCAIQFDQCHDDNLVQKALEAVGCSLPTVVVG